MTKAATKSSRKKNAKIRIAPATYSEIVAAYQFTAKEMRLADKYLAEARRSTRRSSRPAKRAAK